MSFDPTAWARRHRPEPEPEPLPQRRRMTPEDVAFWNIVLDEYGADIPDALEIALDELAPSQRLLVPDDELPDELFTDLDFGYYA